MVMCSIRFLLTGRTRITKVSHLTDLNQELTSQCQDSTSYLSKSSKMADATIDDDLMSFLKTHNRVCFAYLQSMRHCQKKKEHYESSRKLILIRLYEYQNHEHSLYNPTLGGFLSNVIDKKRRSRRTVWKMTQNVRFAKARLE